MEGASADNYVIDDNGAWGSPSKALDWYRKELAELRAQLDAANKRIEDAERQEPVGKTEWFGLVWEKWRMK